MLRATVVPLFVLALIILPFLSVRNYIEVYSLGLVETTNTGMTAVIAISLLAVDVVLPIPSSIVSLATAGALGNWVGAVVIWIGMTLGCVIGVFVGRGIFGPMDRLISGHDQRNHSQRAFKRLGWLTLILFRPVPVLAEASVLIAAARGMPFTPIVALTSLANIPVALLYGYFGARLLGDVPFLHLMAGVGVLSLMCIALRFLSDRRYT